MARVILISPHCGDTAGSTSMALTIPPLGLAYLAAVLDKQGHQVQIIDANLKNIHPEEVTSHFEFEPDLVGLGINLLTYKRGVKYAEHVKEQFPNVTIFCGGPHASTQGKHVLEKNDVLDAIIFGEGENTMVEIAQAINKENMFEGIKGVIYKYKGDIIQNEPRPLIQDLDEIPFPAYHLLPPLKEYRSRSRATPVGYLMTSRGCPAACTFCGSRATRFRVHSPKRVIEEIEYLVKHQGIKQIDVFDDNFTFDKDRAMEIFDLLIEKKFKLKINMVGIRVDKVNEPLLRKMKEAGVFKIGFGIESGDEAMLKRLQKGIKLDQAIDLVKKARKIGLVTHGFYIVGLPKDTPETINRTIDFAKELNPHFASFSIYTPLPGTKLFDEVASENKLSQDIKDGIDKGFFSLNVLYEPDHLTAAEVADFCQKAWKKFYLRPFKIIDVASAIGSMSELKWLMRMGAEMVRTKLRKTLSPT